MNDHSSAVASPTADGLADRAGHLKDQVCHTAALAKGIAVDGLKSAQQKAASALRAGADQAVELKDRSVVYIRENPLKTVLIAAGIGALAGILLARRR